MYEPGSQRALKESIRRQNELIAEKEAEEQRRKERIWRIYMEVKDWIAIVLSVAALIVSVIALRGSL